MKVLEAFEIETKGEDDTNMMNEINGGPQMFNNYMNNSLLSSDHNMSRDQPQTPEKYKKFGAYAFADGEE